MSTMVLCSPCYPPSKKMKMRIPGNIHTAILLLFSLLSTAPSTAEIISMNLRYSTRHVIEFAEFNFTHTGHVSIAISSVWVTPYSSQQPNNSRIGFFLLSNEARMLQRPKLQFQTSSSNCIFAIDSKSLTLLFTFQNLSSHGSFDKSYPITTPGLYSLYFINCNENSFVTMDVHTELYNTENHGNTKNYLSAGLSQLPSLYFIFSIIYLCFLVFWVLVCVKNKHRFHRIHLLMGVLLVATFAYFISAALDRQYVKVTGTPHGWDFYFYMFKLATDLIFFILIVLIIAGWRMWKPVLRKWDKLILVDVIVCQVGGNFSSVMVGEIEHYSENWPDWKFDALLGDYLSWAVIFLLYWAKLDTDTGARNLAKLYRFVEVIFGYVLVTRIVVPGIVVSGMAPQVVDKWPWVIDAVKETGTLVFCLVMYYMYGPFENNEFEKVDGDEEEIGLVSLTT